MYVFEPASAGSIHRIDVYNKQQTDLTTTLCMRIFTLDTMHEDVMFPIYDEVHLTGTVLDHCWITTDTHTACKHEAFEQTCV